MTTKTLTIYDRAEALSKGQPWAASAAQFALVKAQCCGRDFTDDEFLFFAQFAASKGLNPLAKEIYTWKQQGKLIFITSIDGFRKKAGESGRYNGQTAPEWMDESGNWHTAWMGNKPPVAARVGVRLIGVSEPTYATVMWSEFNKGTPTWKAMPAHMLAKVAESHALRKAFPDKLSGLYTDDEVGGGMEAPRERRQVVNVADLMDDVAPDVVEPPVSPGFDVDAWVAGAEQVASTHGWEPPEFDALVKVALKAKGFDGIEQTTDEWRDKFIEALRSDDQKAKRDKRRQAVG